MNTSGKRKVCVFTATRAEYGLLSTLMKEINSSEQLALQTIVSGTHLSPEFGMTVRHIEADGYRIDRRIEMLLSSDSAVGATKSLGLAAIGAADAIAELDPDIVVILGDRYELIAIAGAALLANKPIAHLHGGELTEGAIDDSIRHAITKMARLHFVSTEEYKQRVISMGESPEYVYNVGAIGIDVIQNTQLLSESDVRERLGLLNMPVLLVTYHPVTTRHGDARADLQALLSALDVFQGHQIVFTMANSDPEGREINAMLDRYCKGGNGRAQLRSALGQILYLSLAQISDAVIGNSSSGIIEIPSLGVPVINIGDRQRGRIASKCVLHVDANCDSISEALRTALCEAFRGECKTTPNPYGNGGVAHRITEILGSLKLPLGRKVFFQGDDEHEA